MIILGIETSCDETAAALVEETGDPLRPWRVRSSIVASQIDLHRQWGGIVPELSARQHVRDICGVVERALAEAGSAVSDDTSDALADTTSGAAYDAIAVTQGPGLVGSLLVGLSFAKSLAWSRGVPIVGVHHLAGHIESLVLDGGEMPLPAIVLIVSGGHTSLYRIETAGVYELLGRTRDDAAGEAYDKVAKLLGLGYPGGPAIDRLAATADDRAVPFPKTRLTHADRNAPQRDGRRDFSFSGLKTSVLRHVTLRRQALGIEGGAGGGVGASLGASAAAGGALPDKEVAGIAASFQRVVVETLLDRLFEAAAAYGAKSVGIAGGVSANRRLRADAQTLGAIRGLPVFLPGPALSTDNAAMIAAAGLRRFRAGLVGGWDMNADSALPLTSGGPEGPPLRSASGGPEGPPLLP